MDRAGSLDKGPGSGQGRQINIYTDSHYTFATAHVHGTIYKERGLLTVEGKTIKSKEEILGLLKVLWKPNKMAFVHCPGHHKGNGPIPRGNKLAVKTTWEVAVQTDPVLATILVDPGSPALLEVPKYTQEELTWIVSPFDTMSREWRSAGCRIMLHIAIGAEAAPKEPSLLSYEDSENTRLIEELER